MNTKLLLISFLLVGFFVLFVPLTLASTSYYNVCGDGKGYSINVLGKTADKCCCYMIAHVHDFGKVIHNPVDTVVRYKPGLYSGCTSNLTIYTSINGKSWIRIWSAPVKTRYASSGGWKTYSHDFRNLSSFRYMKVEIPNCYVDFSSVNVTVNSSNNTNNNTNNNNGNNGPNNGGNGINQLCRQITLPTIVHVTPGVCFTTHVNGNQVGMRLIQLSYHSSDGQYHGTFVVWSGNSNETVQFTTKQSNDAIFPWGPVWFTLFGVNKESTGPVGVIGIDAGNMWSTCLSYSLGDSGRYLSLLKDNPDIGCDRFYNKDNVAIEVLNVSTSHTSSMGHIVTFKIFKEVPKEESEIYSVAVGQSFHSSLLGRDILLESVNLGNDSVGPYTRVNIYIKPINSQNITNNTLNCNYFQNISLPYIVHAKPGQCFAATVHGHYIKMKLSSLSYNRELNTYYGEFKVLYDGVIKLTRFTTKQSNDAIFPWGPVWFTLFGVNKESTGPVGVIGIDAGNMWSTCVPIELLSSEQDVSLLKEGPDVGCVRFYNKDNVAIEVLSASNSYTPGVGYVAALKIFKEVPYEKQEILNLAMNKLTYSSILGRSVKLMSVNISPNSTNVYLIIEPSNNETNNTNNNNSSSYHNITGKVIWGKLGVPTCLKVGQILKFENPHMSFTIYNISYSQNYPVVVLHVTRETQRKIVPVGGITGDLVAAVVNTVARILNSDNNGETISLGEGNSIEVYGTLRVFLLKVDSKNKCAQLLVISSSTSNNSSPHQQVVTESSNASSFVGRSIAITIHKGWNLFSIPGHLVNVNDMSCNSKLMRVYRYIKDEHKFAPVKYLEEGKSYWLYSPTSCVIEGVLSKPTSLDSINTLTNGWNLVPVLPAMVGERFKDMGSCVLKAYEYDAANRRWRDITNVPITTSDLGNSVAVMAKGTCKLDVNTTSTVSPPPFPTTF